MRVENLSESLRIEGYSRGWAGKPAAEGLESRFLGRDGDGEDEGLGIIEQGLENGDWDTQCW
jgi:hypothetical protein